MDARAIMNSRILFSVKTCFLLILTTNALALESAPTRWTGFYLGGDLGGTRSDIDMQTTVAPDGTYFNYTQDAPQVAAAGKSDSSLQHFAGGLFAGYEQQFNNIVLGAEISVNNLSIDKSHAVTDTFISDPNVQFVVKQSLKANWQESLRLKLGFAQQCWLAYLTGGLAATHLKYTSSYNDDNSQPGLNLPGAYGSNSTSSTQFSWIVGGGVEYALNDAWSVKAEYLYTNFGNIKTDYPLVPTPTLSEFSAAFNAKASLTVQSLWLGLTYRFA